MPGFFWTHAIGDGHKEVNVQVDTDRYRRLEEKCCRKFFEYIIYLYTRCSVPKDGKYCLAVCSISTSYEYLCIFVLQNHTDVKAYRSREVVMDTFLNPKLCDERQIVSLYALREELLLHISSRLGGSQVLCVCGEVEDI